MNDTAMLERRRVTRTRVHTPAKVIVGNPSRGFDCVVRDISSLGARLELSNTDVLPNIFELTFDSARTLRLCHVAWRTPMQVGVEFSVRQAA
jgi:PilZ domain